MNNLLKHKEFILIFAIFALGLIIRFLNIYPANVTIGFDQARDLWSATTIFKYHDIRLFGPTAGNNPGLHHGVAFWYYIIAPLIIFSGNPAWVAIWNSFFNALSIIVLYFLTKSMFGSKKDGIIAGIIAAVSFYFVQFSGWLSNPTVCLFTVPVFFFGLWEYYKGKKYALPISAFFLGLTIEFELFFIYLVPVFAIAWLILRPKFPSVKLSIVSIAAFCIATSTMIITEFKLNFAGIKAVLGAGQFVGGNKVNFLQLLFSFLKDRWETFYLNFIPQNNEIGTMIGIIVTIFFIYQTIKNKKIRKQGLFLLLWFFSPAIMFFLGVHNAPWFYIGRPNAAIIMLAFSLSKIKYNFVLSSIIFFIIIANIFAIFDTKGKGQVLLEPDLASLMSDQLKVIDYTYNSSKNSSFEINTLTNPLYINAVWSYHYLWYGQKTYGFLPSWVGGDQLYPYGVLPKPNGKEKFLYLIMDTSFRIPPQYKNNLLNWADTISTVNEEKKIGGIDVQKRIIISKK